VSVLRNDFLSRVVADSSKRPGIEAGSALIADAFLNDLAGKMLADDDLDVLRQGATDAIYHFGAPNATGMPPNDKGALAVR
jgi:PBP1b-binding outer membrane lipoprotein LpoB